MSIVFSVNRIGPKIIDKVRKLHQNGTEPKHPFYKVEERNGTGNAACRACGDPIEEGDTSIFFHYAPDDERPWMQNKMSIHLDECTDKADWVKCPRCQNKDIPQDEWPDHWRQHRYDTNQKAAKEADLYESLELVATDEQTSVNDLRSKERRAMIKTAWHHPPEPKAMEIGEEEYEGETIPKPMQVPEKEPVKTPEPEKVPAGVRTAGDEAIGASGESRIPPHAVKAEDDTLVAYRYAKMKKDESGQWKIHSPIVDMDWERGPATATCDRGGSSHEAPDASCSHGCGIYALWNEKDVQDKHLRGSLQSIMTQVKTWGKYRAGKEGIRSKHAQIVGIRTPHCRYCHLEDESRMTPSVAMSEAGWAACDKHVKEWDKKIRDEEGDGPEVQMPKWEPMHKIMGSLAGYYGADTYPSDKPMRYQPGFKEEDTDKPSGDWDDALHKELGGFESHVHFGSATDCGICKEAGVNEAGTVAPIDDIDQPLPPQDRAGWKQKYDAINDAIIQAGPKDKKIDLPLHKGWKNQSDDDDDKQ